jgi:hypothetical protein
MTPLLAILLLATPPTTIHPTSASHRPPGLAAPTHQEAPTMAQPLGNAPGGGNNHLNKGHGIAYPVRGPLIKKGPLDYRGPTRIGRPAAIIEHTNRPKPL